MASILDHCTNRGSTFLGFCTFCLSPGSCKSGPWSCCFSLHGMSTANFLLMIVVNDFVQVDGCQTRPEQGRKNRPLLGV